MRERETLRKEREPLELSPCPVDLLDQEFSFSSFSGKNCPTLYIKQANLSVHRCFLQNIQREREREHVVKFKNHTALAPIKKKRKNQKKKKEDIYLFRHKIFRFGRSSASVLLIIKHFCKWKWEEKEKRNMGFGKKEYAYLKNRILPNLAKDMKQPLLCTSTVYMFAFSLSRLSWCGVMLKSHTEVTEPGTKPAMVFS